MTETDIEPNGGLMRIFVTGGSGWIGSATTSGLVAAGHQVVGLARSEEAAKAVTAAGAETVRGSLDDIDLLRAESARSDGVIHLAFRHDMAFSGDFHGAAEADRRAIDAFGDALDGSGRPLVVAAGLLGVAPGALGTEHDLPDPTVHPRVANTHAVLALAARGVRAVVVRFAPTVHGEGDSGFIATLVDIARHSEVSGYIGDGINRWPAVHRLDAADLVRRSIECAPAGSVLHAADEAGITIRTVADSIGRQLGVPVASIPSSKASDHFGYLSDFVAMDAPASSTFTRELLGWRPRRPGLLAEIDGGLYTQTH